MKKILILLFVFAYGLSEAQISIPKDTTLIRVGYIEVDLATYDIRKLGDAPNDSIIRVTTTPPPFVEQSIIDNVWRTIAYHKDTVINKVHYSPKNKPIFKQWLSGKITVSQGSDILDTLITDKSRDLQLWLYLDKAFKIGASPNQYATYPKVDTLLHWNEYHAHPVDTITIDTIIN